MEGFEHPERLILIEAQRRAYGLMDRFQGESRSLASLAFSIAWQALGELFCDNEEGIVLLGLADAPRV